MVSEAGVFLLRPSSFFRFLPSFFYFFLPWHVLSYVAQIALKSLIFGTLDVEVERSTILNCIVQKLLSDNTVSVKSFLTSVNEFSLTGIASPGDAAVNVATSSGNITIDAQGNDTDIIFKGTDGGSDTTFLTIEESPC